MRDPSSESEPLTPRDLNAIIQRVGRMAKANSAPRFDLLRTSLLAVGRKLSEQLYAGDEDLRSLNQSLRNLGMAAKLLDDKMAKEEGLSRPVPTGAFDPAPYVLDWDKAAALHLTRHIGEQSFDTTLGAAYEDAYTKGAVEEELEEEKGEQPEGKERIGGPPFVQHLLEVLVGLGKKVRPYSLTWFCFEHEKNFIDRDSTAWHFFLVHQGSRRARIIDDHVVLIDGPDEGFDRSIFIDKADRLMRDSDWSGDAFEGEASARFWYRRFYTQTEAGQILVLRSDEPPLFHFPEGRSDPLVLSESVTALAKTSTTVAESLAALNQSMRDVVWMLKWVVGLIVLGVLATIFSR